VHLKNGLGLRPGEVLHVLGCHPVGPGLHELEGRLVEASSHPKRPRALDDGNVFVDRMNVRQRDISQVLVNPKDEGLSRLAEIA
jgi:hypothetical protein